MSIRCDPFLFGFHTFGYAEQILCNLHQKLNALSLDEFHVTTAGGKGLDELEEMKPMEKDWVNNVLLAAPFLRKHRLHYCFVLSKLRRGCSRWR